MNWLVRLMGVIGDLLSISREVDKALTWDWPQWRSAFPYDQERWDG